MKVAVLISGQFRKASQKYFADSLKHLLSGIDADIYVHTWTQPGESMNHRLLSNHELESSRSADELSGSIYKDLHPLKVSKILVEDQKNWFAQLNPLWNKIQFNTSYFSRSRWSLAQLYGIYKSFSLVTNPLSYDFIIRVRFDNLFTANLLSELEHIKLSTTYHTSAFSINFGNAFAPNRVYDVFFLAHPKIFNVLANTWLQLPSLIFTPPMASHGIYDPRDACDLLFKSLSSAHFNHNSLHYRYTDVYRGDRIALYFSRLLYWGLSIDSNISIIRHNLFNNFNFVYSYFLFIARLIKVFFKSTAKKLFPTTNKHIHVITFATEKYKFSALIQGFYCKLLGFKHTIFTPSSLPDYINDYSKLNSRGYAFWSWKPYLINTVLPTLRDNECLWYLDSSVFPIANLSRIKFDSIYIPINLFSNPRQWCKSLPLRAFNSFTDNGYIPDASHLGFKYNSTSVGILQHWLSLCNKQELINDTLIMPSSPQYIQHRHDQSLLGYTAYICSFMLRLPITQTSPKKVYLIHYRNFSFSLFKFIVLIVKSLVYRIGNLSIVLRISCIKIPKSFMYPPMIK